MMKKSSNIDWVEVVHLNTPRPLGLIATELDILNPTSYRSCCVIDKWIPGKAERKNGLGS